MQCESRVQFKLFLQILYAVKRFLSYGLQDESTLIWVSSNQEKSLKLASVSRILSGQRTVKDILNSMAIFYLKSLMFQHLFFSAGFPTFSAP
jgi:hypothetical protein